MDPHCLCREISTFRRILRCPQYVPGRISALPSRNFIVLHGQRPRKLAHIDRGILIYFLLVYITTCRLKMISNNRNYSGIADLEKSRIALANRKWGRHFFLKLSSIFTFSVSPEELSYELFRMCEFSSRPIRTNRLIWRDSSLIIFRLRQVLLYVAYFNCSLWYLL